MKPWISFHLLFPLAVLTTLTLLFRVTDLDVRLEALFFEEGRGWVYADNMPWRFLYRYGTIPAIVLASISLAAFLSSFFMRRMVSLRRKALFFVLLMLLGPGLVVNVLFKDHWGRPRPREISAFSGKERFLMAWEKGIAGSGKSFPSGHASMGFYMFSPYFVLRRSSRPGSIGFLVLGLGYGALMGLARMIQGGHFASDVVWAGGFIYLSGLLLSVLLGLDGERGLDEA